MKLRTLMAVAATLGPGCQDDPIGEDLPAGGFTSGYNDSFDDLGIDMTTEGDGVGSGDTVADDGGDTMEGGETEDGSSEDDGMMCEIGDSLSHAADIVPIWMASCTITTGACHGAAQAAGGLDLESDPYDTLLMQTSTAGAAFVAAGDSDASYVYLKLTNRQSEVGGAGGAMPAAPGMIDPCEVEIIEAWISQGAAN